MRTVIHNQSGSILFAALAVALVSATVLTVTSSIQYLGGQVTRSAAISRLQSSRQNVAILIQDPKSWKATVEGARNSSMICLSNTTSNCALSGPQIFALYNAAGQIVYDPTVATQGLARDGSVCNTFSATGNDDCPYRFEFYWEPLCSAAPCNRPSVSIAVKFRYSPSEQNKDGGLNTNRYEITSMIRRPVVTTVATSCTGTPSASGGSLLSDLSNCSGHCTARGSTQCAIKFDALVDPPGGICQCS